MLGRTCRAPDEAPSSPFGLAAKKQRKTAAGVSRRRARTSAICAPRAMMGEKLKLIASSESLVHASKGCRLHLRLQSHKSGSEVGRAHGSGPTGTLPAEVSILRDTDGRKCQGAMACRSNLRPAARSGSSQGQRLPYLAR